MSATEVKVDPLRIRHLENYMQSGCYRESLDSCHSFNRRLSDERRMRLPYIDGQTGVAQRPDSNADKRTYRHRIPAKNGKQGQIYVYPAKSWRKHKYQYLRFFMQPKKAFAANFVANENNGASNGNSNMGPTTTAATFSNSSGNTMNSAGNVGPTEALDSCSQDGSSLGGHLTLNNEDSNQSRGSKEEPMKTDWSSAFYEDDFLQEDGDTNENNSDSDFDFEDYSAKKKKQTKANKAKAKAASRSGTPSKRRTHADNIPDSEKPFACELCGMRYKTRPGLTYHYNHSHKEQQLQHGTATNTSNNNNAFVDNSDSNNDVITKEVDLGLDDTSGQSRPLISRRSSSSAPQPQTSSTAPPTPTPSTPAASASPALTPIPESSKSKMKTMSGKDRAPSLGYCDFCLGGVAENKKTGMPEELVSCAECGRSGHPSCLQFTEYMLLSVKEYPWQCIECKCCTICGTSENDEQLLFCDDCDRGYHMYCLVPPMKEAPEGSWSCDLCIEKYHKNKQQQT